MPDGREPVSIKVLSDISEVPPEAWDACAGAANPFVSHAFLSALEEGDAVTAETGWLPQHLAVLGNGGRVSGVAPVYVKGHSYGEYVFDHGWAHAYERTGGIIRSSRSRCRSRRSPGRGSWFIPRLRNARRAPR